MHEWRLQVHGEVVGGQGRYSGAPQWAAGNLLPGPVASADYDQSLHNQKEETWACIIKQKRRLTAAVHKSKSILSQTQEASNETNINSVRHRPISA